VNFQGSSSGDKFYINLGAQPLFIPAEGNANPDLKNLKEYECILRRRVGAQWLWMMSDAMFGKLEAELLATLKDFFGHAQDLRESIAVASPETLIHEFSSGTTDARAALHLARGSLALGYPDKASALAMLGLELAGKQASALRFELKKLLDAASAKIEIPHRRRDLEFPPLTDDELVVNAEETFLELDQLARQQ
jgi:Domain of unknown function (DUF4304)